MKADVLKVLRAADNFVSGQELCDSLGVSRTAVWKIIKNLQKQGYEIEGITGKGYRLKETPDILSEGEIKSCLTTKWIGKNVCYFDEIDSTNTKAKLIALENGEDGTLVAADLQTMGRGRRGRSWVQKKGENISMTLLLKPDIPPDRAPMITLPAALAVRRGILSCCGLDTMIKWPNDVVSGGRKLCGILTEMGLEQDYIQYVVVGIGINVNTEDYPNELKELATSLCLETGKRFKRSSLIAAILKEFEELYEGFLASGDLRFIKDEYNSHLAGMGGNVRVLDPKGEYLGQSLGINETGELLVQREDGEVILVSSGEISVRGIYGYV